MAKGDLPEEKIAKKRGVRRFVFWATVGLAVLAVSGYSLRDLISILGATQPVAVEGTEVPEPTDDEYWHAGWGPERDVYTIESGGAPYPVFNSITNNADYGDERNFVTIKPTGGHNPGGWSDDLWINPGETIFVRVYGENSGFDSAEDVPAGALQDAQVRLFLSEGAGEHSVGAELSAKNAQTIWDGAIIHHRDDVVLEFVEGSGLLITNAHPKGGELGADALGENGALLGYDERDGVVKPGYKYSFYAVYEIRATAGD